MPAYLYQRVSNNGKDHLKQVRTVSLGGGGAISTLWAKHGKPIEKGWHITADELKAFAVNGSGKIQDHEVIIDAAPSVKSVVDLVRVCDIYVYTHGESTVPAWSTMMVRVKSALYEDGLSANRKDKLTIQFEAPKEYGEDIFTFLYLHGQARSWNWGRIGQMNGAWLLGPARKYFSHYFK